MEPYKRRDAEKLYNDLLQQVHQQMISYREITNNKLSMIEEMLESLVQEVKVDSMVKEENEHEEFMNPIVSKEWNTRSLSHLQIMFPKLEGAEVIKCSPDSEQQEFTGNPIYDEEPGEGQECWPEKEFILAALNGRNPKSSKLVQPEICTSERPEASEELSYTQVTQNRKIIAREMIRENPKKNGDNLFEVKKLDLSHEWEDECPVDDCVHDTYKEDLEGIDLAYDSRMVFTFGVFPRVKMKFTVLLVVIALNRSNGIGGSDHGNEKGLKGFSIDSLMDGVSEVVSNTTAAAAIERVTLLIQNQYESSNYEEVEQNTPLSAILKPSPKATLSEQGPLCGNGSSGDMGIAEFLDLILACSNESPWNILAELPTSAPNILTWLEQAYCESIGYEYIHLADRTQYNWLRDKIETPTPMQYNRQRREVILDRLIWSIQFENFLATKWTAAKRFGLEGDETLIHGIKEMFDRSADLGVKSIVIGMSHRGRLNVLGNVARKPLGQIFYEFINGTKPVDEVGLYTGTEDVKYHLGTSYDWPTRGGKRIQLSLDANPSHLEAVDPLVVGKTRAKQYYSNDVDRTKNMGILIHGDGSFAGQGVVYETLHLSALPNYTTGGTIHIVVNNQVAFTTDPKAGRSSQYCTDVAKALDAPIFHVNGDDMEAVVHVCELAAEWRQKFHSDVVVDIVCYRRFGHNEIDEPSFTQPKMYKIIRNHPSALEIYQNKLLESGQVTKEDIEKIQSKVNAILNEEFIASKDYVTLRRDWLSAYWTGFKSPEQVSRIRNTGVKPEILKTIGKAITTLPENFKPHRAVKKIFGDRAKMIETEEGIDWAVGEALAFATLLVEGNHVRLSGQDVERGTFSHRHSVVHDQETGEKYCPLDHVVSNQNEEMFTVSNSSLSEFGVLGFELGYSMENPNSLVLWEAQFGDFSNGAQVIFDQFLSSGEAKWLRQTGLVVVLPHGYDGQGPEHSSARLERFLQMSDDYPYAIPEMDPTLRKQIQECNWQVVNVTTPANYFHVLRRQIHREFRKPLIVMAPKNLLRHKECKSNLSEFDDVQGHPGFDKQGTRFKRLIKDQSDHSDLEEGIRRLVLCSGKVYYELDEERKKSSGKDIAICRVEQLCPFPYDLIQRELKRYPNAEIVWCQEEPMNMGAYTYIAPRLSTAMKVLGRGTVDDIKYVGRSPAAATATGFYTVHGKEQTELVQKALQSEPINASAITV